MAIVEEKFAISSINYFTTFTFIFIKISVIMIKIYFSIVVCCLAFVSTFGQTPCSLTLTSGAGTDNQTVCYGNAISDISYLIGGTATGAVVSTLPAGLMATYNAGVFTISGSPSLSVGIYSYSVTTTGGTCSASSSVFTIKIENPKSNFTANYSLGSSPITVKFTNYSENANTYQWMFGDGTNSNVLDTSITYTFPAKYTVELIASINLQCPDTAVVDIFNNTTVYFALFTTSYDAMQNNFILNVDPLSTSKAVSYKWDFGDGTTSKLSSPTHTFTKDSVYNVCMKIYTATGDSCTYCHQIGKDASGNIYRTAGFTLGVTHITSITEIKNNENVFSLSPNPTSGLVKVMFNKFVSNTSLKLYNSTGEKLVEQNNINGNQYTIDIVNQASGIYILEVNQSGTISRTKLIKE